jgi:hypothetical protein
VRLVVLLAGGMRRLAAGWTGLVGVRRLTMDLSDMAGRLRLWIVGLRHPVLRLAQGLEEGFDVGSKGLVQVRGRGARWKPRYPLRTTEFALLVGSHEGLLDPSCVCWSTLRDRTAQPILRRITVTLGKKEVKKVFSENHSRLFNCIR